MALQSYNKEIRSTKVNNPIRQNLKLLFEFHTGNRVIKGDPEFEQYINDILDMIAEIEEKLKN